MIDPNTIFSIQNPRKFARASLEIFRYQAAHNPVYKRYLELRGVTPDGVKNIEQIPFLPIQFFKTHDLITGHRPPQASFTSSGTTGSQTSRHQVVDPGLYEKSFLQAFELFYGDPSRYCFLALLPSYLERKGSSLVYMAERLIQESGDPGSGFFLKNTEKLLDTLAIKQSSKTPTILLGVSFALLDLARQHAPCLSGITVMETGGMKGRRKEITRQELHAILKKSFKVEHIHSEYGMTELLSQAYSKGNGLFQTPPWMKVLVRDAYDPYAIKKKPASGGLNIIDLANIHSISFIETQDIGTIHEDGRFEVLGRMDMSDVRGCNLMVAD
jgi:phenylacetate-coenzyme A ligase PaaK-like adenylate-forming protein